MSAAKDKLHLVGSALLGFLLVYVGTLGHWQFWLAAACSAALMFMGELLAQSLRSLSERVRELIAEIRR